MKSLIIIAIILLLLDLILFSNRGDYLKQHLTQYHYNLFEADYFQYLGPQQGENSALKKQLAQNYESQLPGIFQGWSQNGWRSTLGHLIVWSFPGILLLLVLVSRGQPAGENLLSGGLLLNVGLLTWVTIYDGRLFVTYLNPELKQVLKIITSESQLQFFKLGTTQEPYCTNNYHLRDNLLLLNNIYLFYALLNPQTYVHTRNYFQSHQGVAKIKQFLTVIQTPALQKCLTTDQATFKPLQAQIAQELDQLLMFLLQLLTVGLQQDFPELHLQLKFNNLQQKQQRQEQTLLRQGQQAWQALKSG